MYAVNNFKKFAEKKVVHSRPQQYARRSNKGTETNPTVLNKIYAQ